MISKVNENLAQIKSSISSIISANSLPQPVTLIAVSKFQPAELIQQAYDSGHRDFGENYIEELLSKSLILPKDINWHMIGHVQSNKINKLLSIQNLASIHTIDSLQVAQKISQKLAKNRRNLNCFIQINTSGEASKSGISPENCRNFAEEISESCPNLVLKGLMTIGEKGSQEDFKVLQSCRLILSETLRREVELSMGMSSDYEEALLWGSNYVRIGTSIFGLREASH